MGWPICNSNSPGSSDVVIFQELRLRSAYLIDIDTVDDSRGFFARTYCSREFQEHRLTTQFPQSSIAFNCNKYTLRGMHFQAEPFGEVKVVRCTRGAIYDVVVDLRSHSPTFMRWEAVELTADNRRSLYVPENFAHGYLTLHEETEVSYQLSTEYVPDAARGVRWNDPKFSIYWPHPPRVISTRDQHFADFEP